MSTDDLRGEIATVIVDATDCHERSANKAADAVLAVLAERGSPPLHHHEYVSGRCYRCGLASPTQWIGALDGRPVNPENGEPAP